MHTYHGKLIRDIFLWEHLHVCSHRRPLRRRHSHIVQTSMRTPANNQSAQHLGLWNLYKVPTQHRGTRFSRARHSSQTELDFMRTQIRSSLTWIEWLRTMPNNRSTRWINASHSCHNKNPKCREWIGGNADGLWHALGEILTDLVCFKSLLDF